jgi:hypothetical protein
MPPLFFCVTGHIAQSRFPVFVQLDQWTATFYAVSPLGDVSGIKKHMFHFAVFSLVLSTFSAPGTCLFAPAKNFYLCANFSSCQRNGRRV